MKNIINNWRLFLYALKYIPQFILLTIIDNLFLGFLNSFVTVIFLKIVFDQIEAGVAFGEIMHSVIFLLLFLVVGYVFHVVYMHLYEPRSKYILHSYIQRILFEKLSKIDMACYDNPSYYDDYIWIVNEADKQIYSLVKDMGTLLNRLISVGTIVALLSTIDWMMTTFIVVLVAFSLLLKYLQTKVEYECERKIRSENRKETYLNNLFVSKDCAKEINATDISSIIDREFEDVISKKEKIIKRNGSKAFFIGFGFDFFTTTFFNIGIFLLLLYKIQISTTLTLGDFAAATGSCWKLFWQLNSFADVLVRFQKRDLYSHRFQEFMTWKSNMLERKPKRKMPEGDYQFSFCNVSFKYPGSDEWILRDINFQIKPCEKIAIVGYNGAGKTTLVRLILRLYNPTEGQILLNGFDIRDYDIDEYRAIFGTTFQNFNLYAFSVAENILMKPDIGKSEVERIERVLKQCGIWEKINSYPKGIYSRMTKEFDSDGVELSGGQLQKMVLARAFAYEKDVMILDEPTSAHDPISEYEIYKNMLELFEGRICIVISHRLSITKDMDCVLFIEKGRIVEKGSHENLLKEDGRYAEIWNVQANNFL